MGSAYPFFPQLHPSFAEPFRNLKLVFYLLVIFIDLGFSLTISSHRLIPAASPESCCCDSAQKVRLPNRDRYVEPTQGP
jgi:hypothetical protein